MFHSLISPPDISTRHQNRANVATFVQGILATNILHQQLVNYMWDSHITKTRHDNQNRRGRAQVQRGGVVYSHNMDRDIAGAVDRLQAWESLNLSKDQKLYRLKFSYSVLPQLMLRTKHLKQKADQSAVNTLRRMTRKKGKKEKEEEE